MLNFLYRVLLTFNSTFWIIVLFGVKHEWTVCNIPILLFNCILLLIPIITSGIALLLSNLFANDNLSFCNEVEYSNSSFIPTYLGYFFVGLSLENINQLIIVYIIVFVFTQLSQTQYFNPIYLLFGYNFYHITSKNGTKLFIITRRKIRNAKDENFKILKRINETTFIELRRTKDESTISKN